MVPFVRYSTGIGTVKLPKIYQSRLADMPTSPQISWQCLVKSFIKFSKKLVNVGENNKITSNKTILLVRLVLARECGVQRGAIIVSLVSPENLAAIEVATIFC